MWSGDGVQFFFYFSTPVSLIFPPLISFFSFINNGSAEALRLCLAIKWKKKERIAGRSSTLQKEKKKTANISSLSCVVGHLSSFSFFLFVEGWIVMVCLAIFRWGTLFHHFLIQQIFYKQLNEIKGKVCTVIWRFHYWRAKLRLITHKRDRQRAGSEDERLPDSCIFI